MSGETTTQAERGQLETAWHAFEYWTGSREEARFTRSYLGHYASRAAFGVELAERLGIEARLARLPEWTRAYLRVDGEAVLRDFEAAGHFWVYETPEDGGAFVFDAEEVPPAD